MTQTPWRRTDSPAIREATRSAARTAYISFLVMAGLLGLWNVFEIVSDLKHGRDITWSLFSIFMLLVATGFMVSRWRRDRRRQQAEDAGRPDGDSS